MRCGVMGQGSGVHVNSGFYGSRYIASLECEAKLLGFSWKELRETRYETKTRKGNCHQHAGG